MYLDLKVSFKDENDKLIKYEFGTSSYDVKNKKYVSINKTHSEILAIKHTITGLLEELLKL